MSTYPPDGWHFNLTWGTDAQVNTAITNRIGSSCIEFKNTTPGSDPAFYPEAHIPVQAGRPYKVSALVQADSIAVGNWVRVRIHWYDSSKSYLSYDNAYYAVLDSTGTWYELSDVFTAPSNARYARPVFYKNNTAFTAYLDHLALTEVPVCFHAYENTSDQTIGGSPEKVTFSSEVFDYGDCFDDSSNYRFTAQRTGLHGFSARVMFKNALDGFAYLSLYKNGVEWLRGDQVWSNGTTTPGFMVSASPVYLERGDYVEVYVAHSDALSLNLYAGSHLVYFTGGEL